MSPFFSRYGTFIGIGLLCPCIFSIVHIIPFGLAHGAALHRDIKNGILRYERESQASTLDHFSYDRFAIPGVLSVIRFRALGTESFPRTSSSPGANGWWLAVNLWIFAVGILLIAQFVGYRNRKKLSVIANGQCKHCGYDIRLLSTNICPECGAPFELLARDLRRHSDFTTAE